MAVCSKDILEMIFKVSNRKRSTLNLNVVNEAEYDELKNVAIFGCKENIVYTFLAQNAINRTVVCVKD